jgi:mono/diheme cytochrome c family protein
MAEIKEDHNSGGLIAFIFSMGAVLLFFLYLVVIHPGVDLKEGLQDPQKLEAGAAAAPAFDISKVTEPWVENADVAKHGSQVFAANCAMCHGKEGKGDGPAGAGLNPKPRNLVEGQWKQGGDSSSLFTTLTNGIQGSSMPGFKQLAPADRWALVQFIRSITENKTADDAEKLKAFAATAK